MSHKGWIGVDLDATLAQYDGWVNETTIGEPIPFMVARVKQWLEEGKEVRIFTARVYGAKQDSPVVTAIDDWCVKHIGQVLPITCTKDYSMYELWDDRAVQVLPNTGLRADGVDDEIILAALSSAGTPASR